MAKLTNSSRLVFLGLLLHYGYSTETELHTVDTNRASQQFLSGTPRPAGYTYLDAMKLESVTNMQIGTITMDTVTEMKMESETKVSLDPTTKDMLIDLIVTRMELDIQSGSVHFSCDTVLELDPEDAVCAPLYDALTEPSHFELDASGKLVVATGAGAKAAEAIAESKSANSVDPAKQWAATTRMLQLISDDNIKPGDSWDSSVDYDDMGQFHGKTTLLGYREVDGVDCAVFTTAGTTHVNISSVVDTMFADSPLADAMQDITMDDYTMEAIFYYQYETKLVRWSKTTQSTVMHMPNPLGSGTLSTPINQEIITTSRIKV